MTFVLFTKILVQHNTWLRIIRIFFIERFGTFIMCQKENKTINMFGITYGILFYLIFSVGSGLNIRVDYLYVELSKTPLKYWYVEFSETSFVHIKSLMIAWCWYLFSWKFTLSTVLNGKLDLPTYLYNHSTLLPLAWEGISKFCVQLGGGFSPCYIVLWLSRFLWHTHLRYLVGVKLNHYENGGQSNFTLKAPFSFWFLLWVYMLLISVWCHKDRR